MRARIEDLVLSKGYPLERHEAVASDGHVLTMYRIPHAARSLRRGHHMAQERVYAQSSIINSPANGLRPRYSTGSWPLAGSGLPSTSTFSPAYGIVPAQVPLLGGNQLGARTQQRSVSPQPQPENPTAAPLGPVLLQHGLMDSSPTWVINDTEKSLAFILADLGFDVWLGTQRGTPQSLGHRELNVASADFWDFSFDEMAQRDVPAMVQHVLALSCSESLAYVGHSQGCTLLVAALASQPWLSSKIRCAGLLAPAVFATNIKSEWFRALAEHNAVSYLRQFGAKELMAAAYQQPISDLLVSSPVLGSMFQEMVYGYNPGGNIDPGNFAAYVRYSLSATSVRNLAHWSQLVNAAQASTFAMYDFGDTCYTWAGQPQDCNWRRYGTHAPPTYSLKHIQTKLAVFSGGRDLLATPEDVHLLIRELGSSTVVCSREIPQYGHLDFVVGENTHRAVYAELVDFLVDAHQAKSEACVLEHDSISESGVLVAA